jgi:hypothetical protein
MGIGVSKLDFKVLSLAIFTISTLMLFGTAQYASAGASPIVLFEFGSFGSGDGQFDELRGVEVDSSNGHIIVADRDNSRIQVFDSTGGFLFEFDGSLGAGSTFDEPKAVAVDGSGNIYVADFESFSSTGLIQKFNSTGGFLLSFTVDAPRGVSVLSSGNIIVIDEEDESQIDVYNSTGTLQFSFNGTLGGGDLFDRPKGVAVDSSDKIYVADSFNDQVQIFNSAGSFLSKFGSFGSGDGQFNLPIGIAVGSNGVIYVADEGNDRIQLFDSSGNFLAEIGSSGSGEGEFGQLRDVAADTSGKFYVADDGNDRIQVFNTTSITPPAAPTITTSSGFVNVNKPEITGDGESGSTITLRDDVHGLLGDTLATSPWTFSSGDYLVTLSEGNHTINATATNPGGESGFSNSITLIVDTNPPNLTVPPNVTLEAPTDTSPATTGNGTATDAVDPSPVVTFSDVNNLDGQGLGTIDRTWNATDAAGNSVIGLQVITVEDTTDPVLTVPADITIEGTVPAGTEAIDIGTANATDTVDPAPVVLNNAPATYGITNTTVTWTATDAAGNSVMADQFVTVQDTTDPTAFDAPDVRFEATGEFTQLFPAGPVVLGTGFGTDIVDQALVITNDSATLYPSGFPQGHNPVHWTATDFSGNFDTTTSQNVTITEITIDNVTDATPLWDYSVTINGTGVGIKAGDTVSVDWENDGFFDDTGIVITAGAWGASHTYPAADAGLNNVKAKVVNGTAMDVATSDLFPINVQSHSISISTAIAQATGLNIDGNVTDTPWSQSFNITSTVTDDDSVGAGSSTTLNAQGVDIDYANVLAGFGFVGDNTTGGVVDDNGDGATGDVIDAFTATNHTTTGV